MSLLSNHRTIRITSSRGSSAMASSLSSKNQSSNLFSPLRPMTTRQEATMCKFNLKTTEARDQIGAVQPSRMAYRPRDQPESAHHRPSTTLVRGQCRQVTSISKLFMDQRMRRTPPIQKTTRQRRRTLTARRSHYRWEILQVIWTKTGTASPQLSSKQTQGWAGQSHQGTVVEAF